MLFGMSGCGAGAATSHLAPPLRKPRSAAVLRSWLPGCGTCWLSAQRRSGTDRCRGRRRRDAGARQAREDAGRVRSRDVPALAAQLHGADRGPVRVHPRRARRGDTVGQHRGAGAQPLQPHTAADARRARRLRQRDGTRVQGRHSVTVAIH